MTTITSLTDTAAVVAAAAEGDAAAWRELIDRHAALIRCVCRSHRLSDADADDVAQLTWLRAVEHINRLRDPDRFGAWVGTTARRECLRILQGRKRFVPTADEVRTPLFAPHVDEEEIARAAERRAAVREALGSLPPKQRTLLRLLHSEREPSYDAISARLGMPVGSIGPTRGRALERLRKEIHVPLHAA
jgi:RNA polymerase sigma factor (sigma-70 family)